MIHHLAKHEDMNRACIYCGAELDGLIHRNTNYVIKKCDECGKTTTIRKDFNEIGNGTLEDRDEVLEEKIKHIFLRPRVF